MNSRFMKTAVGTCLLAILFAGAPENARADRMPANRAKELIQEMVAKVGSYEDLKALRDVEYTYLYRTPDGKEDISLERYRFEGELSWAKYTKHARTLPELSGELIQGYDGKATWMLAGGKRVTEPKALKTADFLRKTNFYWFAMMPKLLDPGVNHTYDGTQAVGDVTYEKVRVTFGDNVGDAQDTYVLFIHPTTKLVDQFLFTVMDFGMAEPLVMKVEYETIDGVTLPTKRKYAPSDWNAQVPEDAKWTDEIMSNIKFKQYLPDSVFQVPTGGA